MRYCRDADHKFGGPRYFASLAHAYRDCMGGNTNLLLNLAPDNTGRLPEDQMAVIHRLAELIRA